MRRRKNPEKQSLRTAFIFVVLVFLFVIISFIFRVASVIGKSSFDSVHRFNVFISSENEKRGEIVSFYGENQSLLVVSKKDGDRFTIPIDGSVVYAKSSYTGFSDLKGVSDNLASLILNYNKVKTNLTIIDMVRMFLFAKTIPAVNFTHQEAKDLVFSTLFIDESISREALSIEVENGTEVVGLGNRLAQVINNMGGNVVIVSTAEKEIAKSEILYSQETSYTVEKLAKILSVKAQKMEQEELSDIIIKIGKDSLKSLTF